RRVSPSACFGRSGWATFGLAMNVIWISSRSSLSALPDQLRRGAFRFDHREHAVDNAACGQRHAVVVQDRAHAPLFDAGFQQQQAAKLRIAVLLDDETQLVRREEPLHLLAK